MALTHALSGELFAGIGIIAGGLLIASMIVGIDVPFAPFLLVGSAILVVAGAGAIILAGDGS
jgi:hypothetical protein